MPPKPAEPAPQKPDLKLPADVVRASKTGGKAADRAREESRRTAPQPTSKFANRPPVRRLRCRTPAARGSSSADRFRASRKRGGKGEAGPEGGFGPSLGGREARQLNRKRVCGRTGKTRYSDRRRR